MMNLIIGLMLNLSIMATDYKGGRTYHPEPLPTSNGQLIYQEMGCVMCHGWQGGGDGFMSQGLDPKPRNFTSFEEMEGIPDIQMYESIQNGRPNTAMPAFKLSEKQTWDVIQYLKSFLADSQMTMTLCANSLAEVDVSNLNIDGKYLIRVDKGRYYDEISFNDNLISIKPDTMEILRNKKRIIRTNIFIQKEDKSYASLIIVRLSKCLKG